ncbi:hypothetical protein FRC06_010561 [Ceratobasidium sp. 370]|nr:hypothetical protein FRC06_010561 [Ceratobasidium sp. 370]
MLRITTCLFDGVMSGRKMPWQRALQKLRQLGVNYRWSSIVVGGPPAGERSVGTYGTPGSPLRAGDRAPDAPGLVDIETQEETSVFATLSCSMHTVFVLIDSVKMAKPVLDVVEGDQTGVSRTIIILRTSEEIRSEGGLPHVRVLADRDGHVFRAYSAGKGQAIVVVRPDGMIGALIERCEDLKMYYKTVLAA